MEEEKHFEIADKIARLLEGATLDELAGWLDESEENKRHFERLARSRTLQDKLSDKHLQEDAALTRKAWARASRRLHPERETGRYTRGRHVAAVACAALLVGVLAGYLISSRVATPSPAVTPGNVSSEGARLIMSDNTVIDLEQAQDFILPEEGGAIIRKQANMLDYSVIDRNVKTEKIVYNRVEVPRGGEFKFQLGDGTIIHMNAESSARFPVVFARNAREIELEGEAYFDVARDETRPFIVKTSYGEVRVTGTKFNLQAYPPDHFMETTLVSGSVEVTTRGNAPVTLQPAQQLHFDENTRAWEVHEVDSLLYTAWRKGKIVFKDCTLEYIMANLSRWYDIEVTWESTDLKQMRFGCKLDKYKTIKPIFELLESTKKIKVAIDGRAVCIKTGDPSPTVI
jgi:ferric-dicitrate binding protein FerR (iron transport regulator)